MKNVETKIMEMLKANGVNATEEQVKAAMAKATAGKQELGKDALDNVAGGFDVKLITELAPIIMDFLKGLGILKGGDDKDKEDDGPKGNTQDNHDNSGLQQNNQTGNNTNEGGMSQS